MAELPLKRTLQPLATVACMATLSAAVVLGSLAARSVSGATNCGNSQVNVGEDCDPPGAIACPPGPGPLLPCGADCTCSDSATGAFTDHYKCYKTEPGDFTPRTVTAIDQFGATGPLVRRPLRLCNPVDKNGEGIEDPTGHLFCYQLRERGFVKRDVLVRNQFGDQVLGVVKPEALCNPAEKDGVPLSSAAGAFLNHFKCYRVKQHTPKFTPRTVSLEDQFENVTATVVKPTLLCNPVNKNGEGVPQPENHLTCYKIKQPLSPPRLVSIEDQFTRADLRVFTSRCRKGVVLCVPSLKDPVDLDVDTDRDETIDDADDAGEDDFTKERGAVVLANLDDDNSVGIARHDTVDNMIDGGNDSDDVAALDVHKSGLTPVPAMVKYFLRMDATIAATRARIFSGDAAGAVEILGPGAGAGVVVGADKEVEITADMAGDGVLHYAVEALTYPQVDFDGTIVIELLQRTGGVVTAKDTVALRVAPWIMQGHLLDNEEPFVVELTVPPAAPPDTALINTQFVTDLDDYLTVDIGAPASTGVDGPNYGGDRWIQDEIEIGFSTSATAEMHAVFDGPRGGNLDGYAEAELLAPDTGEFRLPGVFAPNSLNSFGNLEVTPPLTADGTDWLFGRIYYGGDPGGRQMVQGARDFLDAQEVQGPVELDSDWLYVGHVDEFISFVPFPNAAGGDKKFKVLLASPERAIEILEEEQANGNGAFEIDKIKEKVDDVITNYKADNVTVYQPRIDAVRTVMKARFGLDEEDIIDVPVLFHRHPGSVRASARLPDMVNLLVVNGHLIVPEPWYDPFKEEFERLLTRGQCECGADADCGGVVGSCVGGICEDGTVDQHQCATAADCAPTKACTGRVGYAPSTDANATIHFLDDIEPYHRLDGEVHCGTNSRRTIPTTPQWWEQE